MILHLFRKAILPVFLCLSLCPVFSTIAARVEVGFSPEGSAQQLVIKTINAAQQEIRLMAYSFTSPEVVKALTDAKRRGVNVKVVVDEKSNNGRANVAALNLLITADIPVRTVDAYKLLHDKVIIVDRRHVKTGSFNFSRAAARANSENVLVVWDAPELAETYLKHWQSRWEKGKNKALPY